MVDSGGRQYGGVVGRLEDRVAGGDDDDGEQVAGYPQRRRKERQGRRTGRHRGEPGERHAGGVEAVGDASGRDGGEGGDQRTDREEESDAGSVERQRTGEIERPDDQSRHDHRRDEGARGEARAERPLAEHRQADERRRRAQLRSNEEDGEAGRGEEQVQVERAEVAAAERHGEGIGRERERQQECAGHVEARAVRAGPRRCRRQVATGEPPGQQPERRLQKEDRAPTGTCDEEAAERGTERGADGGHRSEQPHGGAGSCRRNDLADEGEREGQQDRRAEALDRARGDQPPERWRDAAADRRQREERDSGAQQPATAEQVAEPSGADDQGGDGEEVGQHDPLNRLERSGELLRQGRQSDVGNTRPERSEQHGERQGGEGPARGGRSGGPFGERRGGSRADRVEHAAKLARVIAWRKTQSMHMEIASNAIDG